MGAMLGDDERGWLRQVEHLAGCGRRSGVTAAPQAVRAWLSTYRRSFFFAGLVSNSGSASTVLTSL
jgi:hypothetical protein